MAEPTTDTPNDDVKELRADFHAAELAIREQIHSSELDIKDEFQRVAVSLAEIQTQPKIFSRVATLGITVLAGTLIASTGSGIWWASRINYRVETLEPRFEELNECFDRLDTRFDKLETSVGTRFEKLERSIEKRFEQTRPK